MVHVPFLGLDLPEPRLGHLIPDAIDTVIRGTSKALEHAQELIDPPAPGEAEAAQADFEASIPREFDRVRRRQAEGRIVNDEQLSSELEDASFDWYRRLLRTSVLGATDEGTDDVAERRLGLGGQPSMQQQVLEEHLAQQVEAAGGVDVAQLIREAAAQRQQLAEEQALRTQLALRAAHVSKLRQQVRPTTGHVLTTLTSASGGAVLAVLLFKGCALLARKLFKRRGPAQRPQPAASKRAAPAKAAPASRSMEQQAASQQPAQSKAQAPRPGPTPTPAGRTSSSSKAAPPASKQPESSSSATAAAKKPRPGGGAKRR